MLPTTLSQRYHRETRFKRAFAEHADLVSIMQVDEAATNDTPIQRIEIDVPEV
jgi:hypothetical protein